MSEKVPLKDLCVNDDRVRIELGVTEFHEIVCAFDTEDYERFWFKNKKDESVSIIVFYDENKPMYVCGKNGVILLVVPPRLSILRRVSKSVDWLGLLNSKGQVKLGDMCVIEQFR